MNYILKNIVNEFLSMETKALTELVAIAAGWNHCKREQCNMRSIFSSFPSKTMISLQVKCDTRFYGLTGYLQIQ